MIALIIIFVGALLCLYLGIKKQESFSIPIALFTLAAAMSVTVIQLLSKEVWPVEIKMRAGGMMLFDFSSQLFSLLLMLSLFLILAGPMTVIPLFLYVRGVELIGLGPTGMIFYITPTLQFLLGYFYYDEAFSLTKLVSFIFIWIAVIIYLKDLYETN